MQSSSSTTAQLADNRQFVLAVVDSTFYGIDIEAVIEILPFQQPTPIPDAPVNVIGVLDIRGGSVPIADLGACLGKRVPQQRDSRIIVLSLEESRIGFVVDSVAEVVTIPNDSFHANQGTLSASRFVGNIAQLGELLVLSLNHQAVVDHGLNTPPAICLSAHPEDAPSADERDDNEPETESEGLNVDLLETSLELVAPRKEELADYFYTRLFEVAPSMREFFPDDMAGQKRALVGGIGAIVKSLRNGDAPGGFLTGLGGRDVDYGSVVGHYPMFGEVLLESLAHIAGDAWSDDLQATWAAAFGAVQDTMIAAANAKDAA